MDQNKFISWTDIKINEGFWGEWQEITAQNTSKAIYDRFKETGRIDAMKLEWREGMPNKPHVFWDSDIAKWMEGTAYFLYFNNDEDLRGKLETIIDYIEKGQIEDGYFNSAFLTLQPEKRFTDRTNHELYTAGHLIEAAIAHYYATGNERFLNVMKKFADCIEKVFLKEKSASYKTPGHQELELALVRLWQATGEKRYLELSKHFVDARGIDMSERVFSVPNGTYPANPPLQNQLLYNDTYAQDNVPARDLPAASGHAVRAMYFYTAMADLATAYEDRDLADACKRLWNDSVNKKMYVTGGVSAERYGEAIGTEYVLPNDYAYAETCASVAMANFSQRMFFIEQDAKYADMIERQMYNGALVGLSMDGKAFYYDNALQSRPEVNKFFAGINARPLLPAYEREEVFECSCCPPNIYRFIAALGQYFYSSIGNTIFIHQYAQGIGKVYLEDHCVQISQETNYPWDGNIAIHFTLEKPQSMTVAVRIPGWCTVAVVRRNNILMSDTDIHNGYLYINGDWRTGDSICIELTMEVIQVEGNPKIVEANGRVALMRGPLVYCIEGNDNQFNIFDLMLLNNDEVYSYEAIKIKNHELLAIKGTGLVRETKTWENELYRPFKSEYKAVAFKAIPYFAWANRGENDMTVWIKKQM